MSEDQEVFLDKLLMSNTHCSSLLDASLASSLETSLDGSLYIDEVEKLRRKHELLSDAIVEISDGRISPIQRSPWTELGERQQGYYVRKAREVIEATLKCLAPGNEADLWFSTVQSMPFVQSKRDDVTKRLVGAYKLADNRHTHLQILSLFVKAFSKSQLQEMIPGTSNRQIEEARKHADLRGPGNPTILQKSVECDLTQQKLITF